MEKPVEAQNGWQMFAIGSAVFAAVTAIFGKLGVAEINSNLATLIRTVVVVVITACLVTARGEWEPIPRLSRYSAIMLVLSGIATGLSWLCYYRALQMAPASQVAPIDKLSVAIVIVFAVVFLGEPLSWRIAVGGTLIVVGALLLTTWEA
jgi:transporter family protein